MSMAEPKISERAKGRLGLVEDGDFTHEIPLDT
jgi:hypothetical protein